MNIQEIAGGLISMIIAIIGVTLYLIFTALYLGVLLIVAIYGANFILGILT